MLKDLISVIIPIYNKEKYIRKCIESVIKQTYSNLEIFLINDGSIDASGKICEEYAKNDQRIKFISTENRGAARARNTGIEQAQGKFISFIDADDFIDSMYYEIMLNTINMHNADIVECGYEEIEEGKDYLFPDKTKSVRVINREEALMDLYGKDDKTHVKTVIMCNKLLKRELFDDIKYIPGRVIDDETIIYRLINKSKKVADLQDALYAYVQSDNSVMRKDFSMKRLDDSIDVYDECNTFFKKEPKIQAACIKRAIFFYAIFLPKIANSTQINKQQAFKKVTQKYEEKCEQYKHLHEDIKQEVHIWNEIKLFDDNYEKYCK